MSTGVNKIAKVIIPVADQHRAVEFYTRKLGLEKRLELSFGPGFRWIEVAHVDADAEVGRFGEGVPPTFWLRDHEGNVLQVTEAVA